MSSTTPFLGLVLYDSTTDQSVAFATFRAVWGGPATTSNFYKIDTAYGALDARIDILEAYRGAIPVPAAFISANYYEATGITAITSYTTGMNIVLSLDTTSSGTVTLNINSLGTKSVMKVDSTGTPINLTGSDLVDGRLYLFEYDGTRWLWVSANSADQIQIVGTAGNVVTVGSTNNLEGTLTQSLLISQTINSATAKTTLADADLLGLVDSAASNVLKKITWANFATAIGVKLGPVINVLTGKTTPVGADELVIADSAASSASKKITITNLFAILGSLIAGYTGKTTPVGADTMIIADSAASNANKSVLLSNLYKALGTGTPSASTALLGDGSWGTTGGNFQSLLTGGRINVTVSSNNLTVAIKTLSGANPSASSPVKTIIGNTEVSITGALSVTANAATNWAGRGGTKFATIEQDWFVYLGYNSTDGVTIGFSPIPYATVYSDFSATSTAETYCKISTITSAAANDAYVNIGRFAATLSAGAGYTWTVPTFTNSNFIQYPIFTTRQLTYVPPLTNVTNVNGTLVGVYSRNGRETSYDVTFILGSSSAVTGNIGIDLPTTPASHGGTYLPSGDAIIRDTGAALFNGITPLTTGATVVLYVFNSAGTYGVQTATTGTIPMTWTNTDEFLVRGSYIE